MALSVDANRYRREADRCRHRAASAADQITREEWMALAAEYDALTGSADALSLTRRPKPESKSASH